MREKIKLKTCKSIALYAETYNPTSGTQAKSLFCLVMEYNNPAPFIIIPPFPFNITVLLTFSSLFWDNCGTTYKIYCLTILLITYLNYYVGD